jgi:putative glutamine amidotransferase
MKKSLLFFILFLSFHSQAECQLKSDHKLKIGCSTECGFFYRLRLATNALSLGYPIQIVDLSNKENSLSDVDGFIIPGGVDIDPKLYLSKIDPEFKKFARLTSEGSKRDAIEAKLLAEYQEKDSLKALPLLGICRGMQMMSVAKGIPLYVDLKNELGLENRVYTFDKISTEQASISLPENFSGMKLHHQGLNLDYFQANKSSFPDVKITAFSNNGKIAEAIEYEGRPALGVQFHPEMSPSHVATPIFQWFLTQSCKRKNSKGL